MKTEIVRTPLLSFNEKLFLKPENLQPFGSYKIRGVFSAMQTADPSLLKNGVSAASAGNMAQAVAYLARNRGVGCRIYVPDSAPEIKKEAIRKLGATLQELPFADVWEMVRQGPKNSDGLFIHPVFTPGLLEGYGLIANELLEDHPSLNAVVVPFGVGGLLLGVAKALKNLNPEIVIYACEPETAAPLNASLKKGKATSIDRLPSFVDAIGTPEVLPQVFEETRSLVKDSIVVGLEETRVAVKTLALNKKLICEGAAAAGFAAALKLQREKPDLEIACILTGGNIAPLVLEDCLKAN